MLERVEDAGDWTILRDGSFHGLDPYLESVYALYWELDSERVPIEGGISRIPASKARAELERLGLEGEEREEVLGILRELERAHSEWASERYRNLMKGVKAS